MLTFSKISPSPKIIPDIPLDCFGYEKKFLGGKIKE
jgi:hypothetical protein